MPRIVLAVAIWRIEQSRMRPKEARKGMWWSLLQKERDILVINQSCPSLGALKGGIAQSYCFSTRK